MELKTSSLDRRGDNLEEGRPYAIVLNGYKRRHEGAKIWRSGKGGEKNGIVPWRSTFQNFNGLLTWRKGKDHVGGTICMQNGKGNERFKAKGGAAGRKRKK